MIAERATVVGIEGDQALVRVAAAGDCGACAARRACALAAVGDAGGPRLRVLRVANTMGAAEGDEVALGIADSALPTAALLAYLLPLAGLLGGAALAAATAAGDALVALGAGLGGGAGVLVARRLSARYTAQLAPRIEARTTR
jgi:sigma-E factor negative regulatory protein RseC